MSDPYIKPNGRRRPTTQDYRRRPIASPRRRIDDIIVKPKVASPKVIIEREPEVIKISRVQPVVNAPISQASFEPVVVLAKPKKKSKNSWLFYMAASAVFIFGVGVAITQLRTNRQVQAQVNQTGDISEELPPDETKPDSEALNSYTVAPDLPRFISADSLSIKARVRRLGVNSRSQLEAPANIYDAGWYDNSAKPGDQAGAMLIDGHVQGPTKPGLFYDLKDLNIGDVINVERGDGQQYNFKVTRTKVYDADNVDMAAAMVSSVPGKLGLNLITCTGRFNSAASDYEQRLIVFAVKE